MKLPGEGPSILRNPTETEPSETLRREERGRSSPINMNGIYMYREHVYMSIYPVITVSGSHVLKILQV